MIKRGRFVSISVKLMSFYMGLAMAAMLVAGGALYAHASRVIRQEEYAAMTNSLSHIATNVETVISHVDELSVIQIRDESVRRWLQATDDGESVRESCKLAVEKQLMFSVWNQSYISSVQIENLRGEIAFSGVGRPPAVSREIYDMIYAAKGRMVWYSDGSSLAMLRGVNDLNTGRNQGVLRVDIMLDELAESFGDLVGAQEDATCMVDASGRILARQGAGPAEDFLPEEIAARLSDGSEPLELELNGQPCLVAFYAIEGSEWTLVRIIPARYVLASSRELQWTLVVCLLADFGLCAISAIVFSRRLTSPLVSMARHMSADDILAPGLLPRPRSNDEVAILVDNYNSMATRLCALVDEKANREIALKEAEFSALQSQINPHALYNNLDTAYWMSRVENAPKTSEIIWTLSQMYRMSVGCKSEVITVRDELTYLNHYRTLYAMRADESVNVIFELDEDVGDRLTVRFVLQPLLENAVLHGIAPKGGEGTVWIRIMTCDDALRMEVADDGMGADVDRLNRILSGKEPVADDQCIAIRNINDRIRMRFSEPYGLRYQTRTEGGVIAVITQPLHESR